MGDTPATMSQVSLASSASSAAMTRHDCPIGSHEETELAISAGFGVAHVEPPELDRAEVHLPAIVVDFFEPDELTGEAIREVPLRLPKRNDAVGIPALLAN